jgi:hypothetical protein
MVEATEAGQGDDLSLFGTLNGTSGRRIALERHVRTVLVIEFDVLADAPKEMTLAEHDEVIGELAPECSDQPFGISILPRRSRRDPELTNAKIVHASIEDRAKDPVAIADEELERAVLTEGLDDLLRRPLGIRMGSHVHVEDPSPLERQDDEDVEDVEGHRRDREEVDGDRPRETLSQVDRFVSCESVAVMDYSPNGIS